MVTYRVPREHRDYIHCTKGFDTGFLRVKYREPRGYRVQRVFMHVTSGYIQGTKGFNTGS